MIGLKRALTTNDEVMEENIKKSPAQINEQTIENSNVKMTERNESDGRTSQVGKPIIEKKQEHHETETKSDENSAEHINIPDIRYSNEEDVDTEDDEMSEDDIREMFNAAISGDIDMLEDLLDKPNSDVNVTWYSENLLMAAIRGGQQQMAEFLLDNGVDQNYDGRLVDLKENKTRVIEWYTKSCRQMAYDHDMMDVVELIDIMNNEHFGYTKPAPRTPRLRRIRSPPINNTESHEDGPDLIPQATNLIDADSFVQDKLALPENTACDSVGTLSDDTPRNVNSRRSSRFSVKSVNIDDISEKQSSISSEQEETANMPISKSEHRHGHRLCDGGYETMSHRTSPSMPLSRKPYFQQSNGFVLFCRPTKAFIEHKRETDRSLLRKQTTHGDVPKLIVNPVGCYIRESRMWHNESCKKIPKPPQMISASIRDCTSGLGRQSGASLKNSNNVSAHQSPSTGVQNWNRQQSKFPHLISGGMYQLYTDAYRPNIKFCQNIRPFSSPIIRPKSVERFSGNKNVFSKRARPKTSVSLQFHSNWNK